MVIFFTIGVISIFKLPLEMFPDISFPGLMVQVSYPSSSPEEVERLITRPLEEGLSTVNKLKNLNSTSTATGSRIQVEFETGTNMDMASMEIRDKIDQIRNRLPKDVENIFIRRWSASDRPVISFIVSLGGGERQNLYDMAENLLKPHLERIEGVANVTIRGIQNKQLIIALDPDRFYASGVNQLALVDAVRNNNLEISVGALEDGRRFNVRAPGELMALEQIRQLPVNDKGVKIKDFAAVSYDYPKIEEFFKLNGRDSISFRIFRASTANVVDVCRKVKAEMDTIRRMESRLKDMDVLFFQDQSKDILNSLTDLAYSGLFGALLAVVVLLVFLKKLRSTIVIAMAIPVSIVFTFSLMYLFRGALNSSISINVISLSGLMMALGMLVDNSVVVLENIFRLRQEKGYSVYRAALEGSSEVAMAVTASTLTTLVVFVSLGFLSGSGFGRFMKDFAITISLALTASLIIALTFIPLAGNALLAGKSREKARWLQKLTLYYEKIISVTIRSRLSKSMTVLAAMLIFASSLWMMSNVEQEYMPAGEERNIEMSILMPRSYSLDDMIALFRRLEKIVTDNKKELSVENVTADYGMVNLRQDRYVGRLELYFAEVGPNIAQIKEKLKTLFPRLPGVSYEYGERHGRGGASSSIEVELVGMDFTRLTELAPLAMEKLKNVPGIEDMTSDLEGGETQMLVSVDREKAEHAGVDSARIARTIMYSLSDRPISKFKTDNKEIDIVVKLQPPDGFTQDDLKSLSLRVQGKQIPVSAISAFDFRMGSTAISKQNKKSRLRISLNSNAKGMMKVTESIRAVMNTIPFPDGYSWSFGSHFRQFQESQQGSLLAIWLALAFIYIIMASLFESFIHPLTILLTVPLALFGVALLFTVTNITLNTSSYLGLLTLFGIVVNNGIILIDHIRTLRRKGLPKDKAIVEAGKDRLRPILMTAITTIFGVLPMSLPVLLPQLFPAAQGRSAMWAPISVAILGGLTTSTFFTLIILPTFYSISDSVTARFKRRFGFESNKETF